MRAASIVSSGPFLIAAESSTIANPAWSQIMTAISAKLLSLNWLICRIGSAGTAPTEQLGDRYQQAELFHAGRPPGVDEEPDRRRPDEADRHRQEDQRLRDLLRGQLQPVGQHGDLQAYRHRPGRYHDDPQQVVDQRAVQGGIGEQVDVVVERELLRGVATLVWKLNQTVRSDGYSRKSLTTASDGPTNT
jgi:hypothetical protein